MSGTPPRTTRQRGPQVGYLLIVLGWGMSSKGDEEFINEDGGHLLRTKTASSDEGGVAAGFAVLDSPYLTPW